ncbi:MAG: hypothetical protein ACHP7N_15800 [Caulobacterales bacterium]
MSSRGRVSTVAAATILLIAGAAFLAGPVAAQPTAADSRAGAADQANALYEGLAQDPITYAKALAPLEQVSLIDAVGPLGPGSAPYLARFFRSASRALAGDASMPIVTFYNPLADAALVTTWRRIDAHWWLSSVRRLDGATLRGAAAKPWWAQTGRPYAQSLQQQAGQTLRAAEALTSDRLKALPQASLFYFVTHLVQGERGLATWNANPTTMAASEKARTALGADKPDQIVPGPNGAASTAQLGAVSGDVRRSLATVAAFRRSDGITVAMASPLRPGLLVFIDFDSAAAPTPLNVTVVDVEATVRSGRPS